MGWIKNSAGEIVTGVNIDSFMPKLDDGSAGNILNKLQKQQKLVDAGASSWQKYFGKLQDGQKWQIDFVQNTDLQKASLDDVKVAQDKGRQAAIAHNNALKQQTLGAKAAEMGMKALSIAANMALTFVVTQLINGLNYLVHIREKVSEAAKEEAQRSAETAKKYEEEATQVDELIQKYKELNKDGVIDLDSREEIRKIQQELNTLLDEEEDRVDLVNKSYEDQLEVLKKINEEKAGDAVESAAVSYSAAKISRDKAFESNTDEASYGAGWIMDLIGADIVADYDKKAAEILEDAGFRIGIDNPWGGVLGTAMFGTGNLVVHLDATGAEENIKKIEDVLEAFKNTPGYDWRNSDIYNKLFNLKDRYETYNAQVSEAAQITLDKVLTKESSKLDLTVDSAESYEEYRSKLVEAVEKNKSIEQIIEDGELTDEDIEFVVDWHMETNFQDIAEEIINDIDKTTVSLSKMQTASENISVLSSAFKQLSSDGFITTKTISEIQEATGLSSDKFKEYKDILLSAKKGSSEFNYALTELTYQILENEFTQEGLKNATEENVATVLRENGVLNANAFAKFAIARANGDLSESQLGLISLTAEEVDALVKETIALYETKEGVNFLSASEKILNSTQIDTSSKIDALNELRTAAIDAGDSFSALIISMKSLSLNWGGAIRSVYDKVRERLGLDSKYEDIGFTVPDFSGVTSDKSGSNKNIPDYEDPTDAIINRINLRSKEIEKQEEEIENLIEIAELENDYKKQISLTNDLINKRKDRLTELETANAGLHNEAEWQRNIHTFYNEDDTESDENLWFDSQGNATEYYNALLNKTGITKEEREAIEDLFEKLSKYKKAYAENAEEIVDTNKQILQDEEKIWDLRREEFDERLEESEYYIQHSKDFGWENGDNEIAARKRVLNWVQSDYYKSLIKDDVEYYKILEENRLKYNEALEEEFNKTSDFASSYYESQKTLLQSHYDVTNSIAEAQHEINKELEASKTLYEYLDEDTRKWLFNQDDYNKLYSKLVGIQAEANWLQDQYTNNLQNATIENLEEITSQYKMQYETLMKSYETAKAELEVAKKRQQLDNVLAEKNVRMLINGEWQWVAKTQDVINAQSELADAEYAAKTTRAGLRQTESINDLTAKQDHLGTVISEFENGVIDLDSAIYEVTRMFRELPTAMQNSISLIDPSFTYSNARSSGYAELNGAKFYGIPDDLLPSGAVKHYATGTKHALHGLAEINENKKLEGLITNNGTLIPMANFSGGEMVFNHEMMENLWHHAQIPWNIPSVSIPDFATRIPSSGQSVVYDIHDFEVNPTDVDSFMQDLTARARSYNAITNKMK